MPGCVHSRQQILHHTISHPFGEIPQVLPELIELICGVRPIPQLLPLVLRECQPVAELELHTGQIQLAAHSKGNATPGADEILLESKTMAG